MDNGILVNYVDKILSFSQNHTYSRDEAEELTQEIFLQAMKNLSTIKDMDKFESWLWGVANNTLKSFRRERGREREMYSSEDIDAQVYYDEYDFGQGEVYEILRKNILQLSADYRDIIVMFYYDNLTSRAISERLNIPEGTVRYRLSIGRNKLKEEINIMNEIVLKPIKLNLYTNGSYSGVPRMYLNDALSHNILYQAYKDTKSIGELSKVLGVPAYYIEDRIAMLEKCGTITRPTQSTILSDILIYDESICKYDESMAKECMNAVSKDIKKRAATLKVQTLMPERILVADFTQFELECLFTLMAFDHLGKKYNKLAAEWVPPSEKFDGGNWEFHAETDEYKNVFFYDNRNSIKTEKHTISHIVYVLDKPHETPNAMRQEQIKVCEKIIKGENINENEKEAAAIAIKNGFIKKTGDKLELNIPYFSIDEYERFKKLIPEIFDDIMPLYQEQVKKYADGYKKLFPKHLQNKASAVSACVFDSIAKKVICEGIKNCINAAPHQIRPDKVFNFLVEHDGGVFFSL